MIDREKVIKGLELCKTGRCDSRCPYNHINVGCRKQLLDDALVLLKDGENTLGTCITANGITFTATGTAKEGEERGIMLGKAFMHEWIYKELLRKGLVTDDVRSVFIQAKHHI